MTVDVGTVLLVHISGEDPDLRDAVISVLTRNPGIRIIILSPQDAMPRVRQMFDTAVAAIIPETESAEMLLSAIQLAEKGYNVLQAAPVQPNPASDGNGPVWRLAVPEARPVRHLSGREAAVLAHLCAGGSNKAIARDLCISDATVKVHLRAAFQKIGVSNRTQAAMWAARNL